MDIKFDILNITLILRERVPIGKGDLTPVGSRVHSALA